MKQLFKPSYINWHEDLHHFSVCYCVRCGMQRAFMGDQYGVFTCCNCHLELKYDRYRKGLVFK